MKSTHKGKKGQKRGSKNWSMATREELLERYSLHQIYIKDLRCDTHHRGSYILLRAFGEPFIKPIVVNAVEDEAGDVDKLAIHDNCEPARGRSLLPRGALVAVKEPFYMMAACGNSEIRVDHPCDLIYLAGEDELIPACWRTSRSTLEYKELGNEAYSHRDYLVASRHYTFGLDRVEEQDDVLRRTLLRNRALASLFCGKFESARSDAMNSLAKFPSQKTVAEDTVGLHRAALASYQLQDYQSARTLLRKLLQNAPYDDEAQDELAKVFARLQEQKEGVYDLHALALSMPEKKFFADCASFIRGVATFAPKGRAPGLFATEDLAWIDGAPIVDVFALQGKMDYNAIGLTPNRPHEPYGDTPDIESGPDKTSIAL
ncbi:hypothetical protein E4T42_03565 [Aureobasidium subglaciale]|nr:hypothetical protein E4T42_03565 [Aureobasidium subglaciale]